MTIHYRRPVPRRNSKVMLPDLDLSWWQQARKLPIPWQPLFELLPDDARKLALSRRGI